MFVPLFFNKSSLYILYWHFFFFEIGSDPGQFFTRDPPSLQTDNSARRNIKMYFDDFFGLSWLRWFHTVTQYTSGLILKWFDSHYKCIIVSFFWINIRPSVQDSIVVLGVFSTPCINCLIFSSECSERSFHYYLDCVHYHLSPTSCPRSG